VPVLKLSPQPPGVAARMAHVMSGNWRRHAVCGGSWDVFFGPEGEAAEERDAREACAIAICRPCPVQQPCLDDALSQSSQIGVAGGVGEERRTVMRHVLVARQRRAGRGAA
jgi:WhiB family transcriptional regulator, redox-sensing transcriptional regulator